MTSEFELMRHALGVHKYGARWKKPYRNYFCAGGDDRETWDRLVERGLAIRSTRFPELSGGDPVYYVTDAGREAALSGIRFARRWGYGQPTNP